MPSTPRPVRCRPRAAGPPPPRRPRTHSSMSATAGPRTSTPVSRHGSRCRARIADPHLADAQPGHERNRAIHGDHLAMVATDPAERAVEARRVVAADLDATRAQALPERRATSCRIRPSSRRAAGRERPRRAFSMQGVGEQAALIVLVNDVHLEVNRVPRGTDRVEPGGIVLRGVFQEPDAVAFAQPRARTRARTSGRRPAEDRPYRDDRQLVGSSLPPSHLCDK